MSGKHSFMKMVFLLAVFLVSSCSGLQKPSITKNYFDLDSGTKKIKNYHLIKQGQVLMIRELSIASEFDSHAFVYRTAKRKYTTDFYNEFVSYPARLITEKISETLYASEYFSPFMVRGHQEASFRLSGKITHLYADFQKKDAMAAVMGIRFVLEKKTGSTFTRIFAQTYQSRVPLSSSKPEKLAAAWSKGLSLIMSDFLNDLTVQHVIAKD